MKEQAQVELAGGIPFISDADLETALDEAGASSETTDAAVDANADARLDGLRSALAILAVLAVLALFLAQSIPTRPPGSVESERVRCAAGLPSPDRRSGWRNCSSRETAR